MKEYTLEDVANRVEQEGLDYALRHYADWSSVDDEEFQNLYRTYIQVCSDLENLLNSVEYEGEY